MNESQNKRLPAWFFLALAGLLLGQLLLARSAVEAVKENPPWLAVTVILISALIFWNERSHFGINKLIKNGYLQVEPAHVEGESSLIWRKPWRLVIVIAALIIALAVLWRIPNLTADQSYNIIFMLWLAAILLFLVATADPSAIRSRLATVRSWPLKLIFALVGITAVAFILRYWRIGSIPFTLSGDEASQGLEAIRVLSGELTNPFSTGWLGVPTMSFFFNSLTLDAFGRTIFALRLPWVFVGTATVLTTFFLVRRMMGSSIGLIAALILALYHYHIHYSRLGSNQIADPLFLSLALFFLMRAQDGKRQLDWALSGIICGLAFYVYAGARLTPVVMLAVLSYWFLLNPGRFWRENRWGLLTALLGFLIVAGPMMQYAVRFPGEFNARLNQVGIIQSGWLEREVEILNQPAWQILWDQFRRAALAFNYYPDRTVWYGLPQPLLDPIFGAVFLFGLILGTMQLFDRRLGPRVAPMVAWWWGGMVLGGVMTESPPSSQRLITLAVPASFFIIYGIWVLLKAAGNVIPDLPRKASIAALVALFGLISLYTYFINYTPQQIYGGDNAEMATIIAPRLNELKSDYHFYFVGAPWMYWGFATLPYLVPEAQAEDIQDPLTEPVSQNLLREGKGELFIVIPPRFDELELLSRTFPQGQREEIFSETDGRHIVTFFKIAP